MRKRKEHNLNYNISLENSCQFQFDNIILLYDKLKEVLWLVLLNHLLDLKQSKSVILTFNKQFHVKQKRSSK